jgi:hypothetical protein
MKCSERVLNISETNIISDTVIYYILCIVAVSSGQTVRLAAPTTTVLKAATPQQGGKQQIILQKPGTGPGGTGQPQIVTLVKTSQGMTVATVS